MKFKAPFYMNKRWLVSILFLHLMQNTPAQSYHTIYNMFILFILDIIHRLGTITIRVLDKNTRYKSSSKII